MSETTTIEMGEGEDMYRRATSLLERGNIQLSLSGMRGQLILHRAASSSNHLVLAVLRRKGLVWHLDSFIEGGRVKDKAVRGGKMTGVGFVSNDGGAELVVRVKLMGDGTAGATGGIPNVNVTYGGATNVAREGTVVLEVVGRSSVKSRVSADLVEEVAVTLASKVASDVKMQKTRQMQLSKQQEALARLQNEREKQQQLTAAERQEIRRRARLSRSSVRSSATASGGGTRRGPSSVVKQ
ncbi:unnamed protein product [Vitrella brassicaformis CCMP3155]|uniref:Uncharacterized protein n=1 Tax=Vitrella brassicaformis (strain CCMP3155) TaxID=1169540 RepID=A0A0G4F3A5_VITBC|nr:unnamed protein product [Vitrella brassicaformis CCMP3155]|eukprot:CEM05843.1 unnamed protein product [Vitrella brassicaformis CCMP3155]